MKSLLAWLVLAPLLTGCVEEVALGVVTPLQRTPAVTCIPDDGVVLLPELGRPVHARVLRDPPAYGLRLQARLEAPGLEPQVLHPDERVQIGAQAFRVDVEARLRDGRLHTAQVCLTRE
ncbi:MAG: hypothetical protein KC613_03360 [Myxococcales bacterium]|nr:hypothetical protein [Myxococcales bacterium]MCB9526722.1 hypothetical protein [Myxococcales bacterium]